MPSIPEYFQAEVASIDPRLRVVWGADRYGLERWVIELRVPPEYYPDWDRKRYTWVDGRKVDVLGDRPDYEVLVVVDDPGTGEYRPLDRRVLDLLRAGTSELEKLDLSQPTKIVVDFTRTRPKDIRRRVRVVQQKLKEKQAQDWRDEHAQEALNIMRAKGMVPISYVNKTDAWPDAPDGRIKESVCFEG